MAEEEPAVPAPPADSDLAAHVYLALHEGGDSALLSARIGRASAAELCATSSWTERTFRSGVGEDSGGERQYLQGGQPLLEGRAVERMQASFATLGLNTLHVLARDCPDADLLRTALGKVSAESLSAKGGVTPGGEVKAGWTAMHLAAGGSSSPEVVTVMLDRGGVEQLRVADSNGSVPMHDAAHNSSSPEVVTVMLDRGGVEQLRLTDNEGLTPLHLAAESNPSVQVMGCLLGSGCERSARTLDGRTPLQLAIAMNEEEVSTMLVEAGADTTDLRLSPSLLRIASRVSMASVLSSYSADRITHLEAAVRLLPFPPHVCWRVCVAAEQCTPSQWVPRTLSDALSCICRHAVSHWAAACTPASALKHSGSPTWT